MALAFDVRVGDLNWLFLVYAIAVVVVILFYLFYFGRLLAWLVSFIVRALLWRRFKIWVDIGSVQFSPLGGRLLFRDVRYVGENQTIAIVMGSITWRYWLWRVRQEDDLRREDSRLPCRTSIKLEGAEWFIYNRNAAFDMLLDRLSRREADAARNADGEAHEKGAARILPPSNENHMQQDPDAIDWFRESLPLELNVIKGAIVMGNRSTPSLVVAGFRSAVGTCGAVKSRSQYDFYKQIFQFTFTKPRILFRKNHDYEEPLLNHGAKMQESKQTTVGTDGRPVGHILNRAAFHELLRKWTSFADLIYNPIRRSKEKEDNQTSVWHGLSRYREAVDDLYDTHPQSFSNDKQYGKVSAVYDNGDSIDLTYYADVAGFVPPSTEKPSTSPFGECREFDIGNGDLSPEWGVDIRLTGGALTYGPWSDRQRVAIQNAFFPPAFFNTECAQRLRPGDRRQHAALKIYIDFSQSLTFRLPSREASKDWKYDGKDASMDSSRRPYGWLDMALGANSSFTFVLPMIAGPVGYETFLELHLDSLMIYSSINYEKFFEAKSCRVSCQLPQPLAWDALHEWQISVSIEHPEVFFLRDHAYLLTDIVRDWTSGDPADYERFVPFTYRLSLTFTGYKLYLYLNECNIVNNPTIIEDNTLLLIYGPKLQVDMIIPSDQYRPIYTNMQTKIEANSISLSMLAPASNTHQAWLTSRTEVFGRVDALLCSLSHTMFSEGHVDNVETLDIDLELDGVLFEALGWVIKYLIEVKDNYFGAFNNFTTSAEADFERSKLRGANTLNPLQRKHDLSPPDIFEVNLSVISKNGIILLPEEVHDCKSGLALEIPELVVHLRNHDYYMELLVDSDPLSMLFSEDFESVILSRQVPTMQDRNRIFIDGLSIAAHRLFGPQPLTATYVALWEFSLGELAGDIAIPHFASIQRIARAFAGNFIDEDNTVQNQVRPPPLPDVTFLQVKTKTLNLNVWCAGSAVNLAVPQGLAVHFNDYASEGALSRVRIRAPLVQARGLLPTLAAPWIEVVHCEFAVSVNVTITSVDWKDRETRQQQFLAEQDSLTSRCRFLYRSEPDVAQQGPDHLGALYNTLLNASHSLSESDIDHLESPYFAWKSGAQSTNHFRTTERTAGPGSEANSSSLSYGALLRTYYLAPGATGMDQCASTFQSANDTQEDAQAVRDITNASAITYTPTYQDEHVTHFQINLDRCVRLMCSPKAIKLAEDVVSCLEKNYEPEHWIDELDDNFRKALPVQVNPDRHETMSAALSIHSISLMLVQDILRPGDLDLPNKLDGAVAQDESILCTAQLVIKNIQMSALSVQAFKLGDSAESLAHHEIYPYHRYRSSSGAPVDPEIKRKELAIRIGKTRLAVKHVAADKTDNTRTDHPVLGLPHASTGTVLEVVLDGLTGMAELPDQYQRFSIGLQDCAVDAVSSAAELVTGTVHSWFIVSRAIEKAVFHAHYRPASSFRRLVTDILQLAHREEIVTDPLFLNRPTAAAVHLRSNTDWKILAHLRHVLRRLSDSAKAQLQASFTASVNPHEDFRNIVARLQEWHNWELDELVIRRLPLIQFLFLPAELPQSLPRTVPQPIPGLASPELLQATDIQLLASMSRFTVGYFEDGQCTNRLELGHSEVYSAQDTARSPVALLRASVGPISIALDPGLLRLIVHVSKVRKVFGSKLEPLIPRPFASKQESRERQASGACAIPLRISILAESFEVATRASGVRASAVVQGLCAFATLHVSTGMGETDAAESQVSLTTDNIKVLAVTEGKFESINVRKDTVGTLISVHLEQISSHATFDVGRKTSMRYLHLLAAVGSSRIRIPRSILRMSQFVEQWRADSLPQSRVAFEALRRDVEREDFALAPTAHSRLRTGENGKPSKLHLSLHVHMPVLNFHIRAAQKFWLDYSIGALALHGDGTLSGQELVQAQSTLNLRSQTVDFIAVNDPRLQGESAPFGGESIHFPAILASVSYGEGAVRSLVTLERIAVTVTAGILDSVFTVQKRFEHDIDELLTVFAKHKGKRKHQDEQDETPLPRKLTALKCSAQLILRGLNLGLKGPQSTQYIGADLIDGYISHNPAAEQAETHWEAHVSNLALSLAQDVTSQAAQSPVPTEKTTVFDRSYRLAYFVLDVHAGNRVTEVEELKELTRRELQGESQTSHLHIKVAKVHAVMQTAAIEALDGLLEHFLTEIAQRRQARAEELAAIKEKVIMTFDIQEKRSDPQVLPWIERCVLSLRISDVGVAIPLQDVEIEAPFFGHPLNPELKARPAFLVSTPSLLFATSKGKAGIASISDLSAQFVQIFDQTKARDFSGYHHETRNRLLLPSSGLKIATDAATASRAKAFTVNAKMSGAQLDIDGSIVESVFQLIKLYEASYDRLARHAPDVAAQVDLTSAIGDKRSTDPKAEPDLASFFDTTSFEATFQVDSGVIRMHGAQNTLDSESQPGEAKKDSVPTVPAKPAPRRRNEQIAGHTSRSSVDNNPPDSFIIPKLTVWSVKKDSVGPDQPSNLHFDALIHSSRNILRPTLIPFLSEIADGVKLHMDEHAVPHRNADPAHSVTKSSAAPKEALAADAVSQEPASGQLVSSSLRHLCLSISLRIDKSSLQLNCGKIAPVSSGLDWQSGGLLVVIKPGQRSLQASVRVDEVGFDVRHAYSPERCITGAAHGLIFAFSMTPSSDRRTLVSANFDAASITGEINFRQLQDFLCFKTVWLDRLEQIVPLPEGQGKTESSVDQKPQKTGVALSTAVLARIQRIKFSCMLGHSIGTVDLTATMLLGRLRQIPMHSRSFSVDLQTLEASSKGRLAGGFKTDGLYFESYLHDIVHSNQAELRNCTTISAFIGKTDGSLEFDYRKTLLLRTEPIKLGVSDDWTQLTKKNELGLDFSLRFGSFNVIATTQTVPTLLKLGKDLEKLVDDRRGKARASLVGHQASIPNTKDAMSKVHLKQARENWKAGAVLPSAIPEGTKVVGKIELEANRLRLAIFLHHFTDQEAFRADAGEVKAVLGRVLDENKTVVRELDLHLGFFSVKKMRPKQRVTPVQEQENTIQDWFDLLRIASDRNIFKFPTSQATMASTQQYNTNRIYHRFSLIFTGQVDISLNYALLKQLGALLAAYQDGMKRIEQDDAIEGSGIHAPESTPAVLTNVENMLDSDVEGPAKRIKVDDLPPPQSVDVVGSREYIALENNIQQPQLQLLGEATPPLEWLGLQRSHAPALVHEGCTLILESALLELSAVYRKSLSKAASIS